MSVKRKVTVPVGRSLTTQGFRVLVTGANRNLAGAHCGDYVTRINPHSNRRVGQVKGNLFAPIGLALGFGSLWIADLDAKTIDRVNVRTSRIAARLRVGGLPIRLGVGFGSVWVRDDSGRVLRIRPQR